MDDGAFGADGGRGGRRSPLDPRPQMLPTADRAEYIAQLCGELETLARGTGDTVLATLLKMARVEASRLASRAPEAAE